MISGHSNYRHEFNYRQLPSGRVPILPLRVSLPDNAQNAIDVDAYLDSGAELSLFSGFIITSLGVGLFNDKRKTYSSTVGETVTGFLHLVRLSLPDVGNFDLEVGFSNQPIRRNLLGRDFFNHFQIGFRERQLQYYLNATP